MKKAINLHLLSLCLLLLVASSCGSNGSDQSLVDRSLIPVIQGDQMGYVDWEGHYVIMPQFAEALAFSSDGLAAVKSHDGLYGYINKEGTYVVTPKYAEAGYFSGGIAFVAEAGGHLQAIDKSGNQLFVVEKAKYISYLSDGLVIYQSWEDKFGALDQAGNEVIPAIYEYIGDFSEDLAVFKDKSGKFGYLDKSGTYAINPQFDDALAFSGGYAVVKSGNNFGVINKKGEYIINPQFEYIGDFSDGLARVSQGGTWGYINTKGEYVINPQFEKGHSFFNGVASAMLPSSDKYGFIDKKGTYMVNPQFDNVAPFFYKGKVLVYNGSSWGIVDKKGKYVVNPQFDLDLKAQWTFFQGRGYYVASQYYDSTELIQNLSQFVGKRHNAVHGINHDTTYGDFRKLQKEHDVSNYEDEDLAKVPLGFLLAEGVIFTNYQVRFDGKLVGRYSFWYGYSYNNDRKAIELSFDIHMDSERRQFSASIVKAITDLLSQQYVVVLGDDEVEASDQITVRISQIAEPDGLNLTFYLPENVAEEVAEVTNEEVEEEVLTNQSKNTQTPKTTTTGALGNAKKSPATTPVTTPSSSQREPASTWRTATISGANGYGVIRSLPSYDGEILNTIDNGTQVEATAHNGEWYKIKWKGQTVYIPKSDLRL